MQRSNVKIIAVAAVVIALCLVFSYLYIGGDSGSDERQEMQIGDYRIYACIAEDSEGERSQYTLTQTVVGIDENGYLVKEDRGISSYTNYYSQEELSPQFSEEYLSYEGTAVDIPLIGERVCDVYSIMDTGNSNIYCVDTGTGKVVYRIEVVEGIYSGERITQYILLGDSMSMSAPEYGASTVQGDIEFGNTAVYLACNDNVGTFPVVVIVQFVAEDGTVTYHNDYTETFGTCSQEEFVAGTLQGGYTAGGSYVLDTPYGQRLCEERIYEVDGGYVHAYIGTDGVCYAMQIADEGGLVVTEATLAYADYVCGDQEIAGQDDLEAGDHRTYIEVYTDSEGRSDYSVRTDEVISVINGVTTYESYVNGEPVGTMTGSYVVEPFGEPVGALTVETVYGGLDCEILLFQADGVSTIMYVHDGIVFYELVSTDLGDGTSYSTQRFLVNDTSIDGTHPDDGNINLGYLEEGSWFDYNIYLNGDAVDSISYEVVSVDGDDVMVSVDDGEPAPMSAYQILNGYPEGADVQLIGQELVETIWGYVVCDVYSLEAEFMTYYYIGASDGINYLTEYWGGEYVYSVYLAGSSTVF